MADTAHSLTPEPGPLTFRDPENQLFDEACALVDAAQRLRRASVAPGAERALAPALGCVEAAAYQLAVGCRHLRSQVATAGAEDALAAAIDRAIVSLLSVQESCDTARAVAATRGRSAGQAIGG
jgi:hypothetical protein